MDWDNWQVYNFRLLGHQDEGRQRVGPEIVEPGERRRLPATFQYPTIRSSNRNYNARTAAVGTLKPPVVPSKHATIEVQSRVYWYTFKKKTTPHFVFLSPRHRSAIEGIPVHV